MNLLPIKELEVDVVEVGSRRRNGTKPCRFEKNISFSLDALESFSSRKWEPLVYDMFVVAAAVEFCDRSLSRSEMNWGRKFLVHVPVHDPDRWTSRHVSQALVEALCLLTGDEWCFNFRPRKAVAQAPSQDRMRFPSSAESVIAYSDGMDSRAVSELERHRLGNRLVRVRVGTKQRDVSAKERGSNPFTAIPYEVKLDNRRNAESSARSRGFKFSVLSGMAAYLIDAPSVIVPESGQGALGPAFIPVGQGYEDYRSYPTFTVAVERFVRSLFGYQVRYQFPRLWKTKGETLREYVELFGSTARWESTRSCWQNSRQVAVDKKRRQCGVCAACMLRRLSVHSAGLKERPETYVWESLATARWEDGAAKGFSQQTKALREYSIAGVLHLDHFSSIRTSSQYDIIKRMRVGELAQCLSQSPTEVAENLDRLLQKHAEEWRSFLVSLGPDSFVKQWIYE